MKDKMEIEKQFLQDVRDSLKHAKRRLYEIENDQFNYKFECSNVARMLEKINNKILIIVKKEEARQAEDKSRILEAQLKRMETGEFEDSIESLEISVRALNYLRKDRPDVTTIEQLAAIPENDLWKIKNIGHGSMGQIKEALQKWRDKKKVHKDLDGMD